MRAIRTILAFGLAVTVASCQSGGPAGDDDAPTPSASGSPLGSGAPAGATCPPANANDHGNADRTGSSRVEMSIELDDNYFEPTCIKVDAGATINLEIENEGDNPHTFTSDDLTVDETVEPGAKREVEFAVGDGGIAEFRCEFHASGGMTGAFDVG